MRDTQTVSDTELLRWGGAVGIAGSIALAGAFVVVGASGLPDTSDVASLVDFPDISGRRTVENLLYLAAVVLWLLQALVLQRLLRRDAAAPALFGGALVAVGDTILAAGALLHVATTPLSDRYHDPAATEADRQVAAAAWEAGQAVLDVLVVTGALLVPVGIALFGVAMRRSTSFHPALPLLAFAVGLIGVAGALVAVIDPASAALAASILGALVFHAVAGVAVLRLAPGGSARMAR